MMKSASRRLVIILLFVASALTYGLATPALCDAGEAEDPHVRKRLGEVSNEGEQKEKIDHPGLEDEKVPDYVEVGPTVTLIQSLSYEPPTDWSFDEFPEPNPYRFVDIHHNTPPDSLTKRVAPPTWEHDTAGCVRIEGTWNKESVPDWPLRCEGNLECGEGGQGGEPAEWFWAAKTMTAEVEIKTDRQDDDWWPENSKLLVSAEHPVVAEGTPDSEAHFVWTYDGTHENWFEPNDTAKTLPSGTYHLAVFTAPEIATDSEEEDQDEVSVQYKHWDKPVDEEPLNITKPTNVGQPTVAPTQMYHDYTINSSEQSFDAWPVHIFYYPISDQFSDDIADSDWGDDDGERILMRREDLDFQADPKFAGVAQYINQEITKDSNWTAHLDDEGNPLEALYDRTVLTGIPTSTLGDPPPAEVKDGDKVFYVHPAHKWQLAVRNEEGSPVPSDPPHVTENEWVSGATEDAERHGNVLIFDAKTTYTVHLTEN